MLLSKRVVQCCCWVWVSPPILLALSVSHLSVTVSGALCTSCLCPSLPPPAPAGSRPLQAFTPHSRKEPQPPPKPPPPLHSCTCAGEAASSMRLLVTSSRSSFLYSAPAISLRTYSSRNNNTAVSQQCSSTAMLVSLLTALGNTVNPATTSPACAQNYHVQGVLHQGQEPDMHSSLHCSPAVL